MLSKYNSLMEETDKNEQTVDILSTQNLTHAYPKSPLVQVPSFF